MVMIRIFQCENPLRRLTYLYNILSGSINLRGGALASAIYNFVSVGNDNQWWLMMVNDDDQSMILLILTEF